MQYSSFCVFQNLKFEKRNTLKLEKTKRETKELYCIYMSTNLKTYKSTNYKIYMIKNVLQQYFKNESYDTL